MPPGFEALLKQRRRLGQDLLDEVCVYHVNPLPHPRHAYAATWLALLLDGPAREVGLEPMISIFNLGEPDDYRVPDGGLFRPAPDELYMPTAELVVEVVSPGDGTWDKLGYYAAHDVRELLIVDPQARGIHWLALQAGSGYQPIKRSALFDLGPAELASTSTGCSRRSERPRDDV